MLVDRVMDALGEVDGDRGRFGTTGYGPDPSHRDADRNGGTLSESEQQDRQLMQLFRDVMRSTDRPRADRIKSLRPENIEHTRTNNCRAH